MPAMDSPTMIREVRKLRPALPVLFMPGYSEGQLRGQIGIADVPFLPEPFSVAQISDKVGAVLAGVQMICCQRLRPRQAQRKFH